LDKRETEEARFEILSSGLVPVLLLAVFLGLTRFEPPLEGRSHSSGQARVRIFAWIRSAARSIGGAGC